jgi:RNA polymerase sigma factor (TIGR02999 family)
MQDSAALPIKPSDPPRDTADLFACCYRQLHAIARRQLHFGGGGAATLSATTLLHQAYLSLCSSEAAFAHREQFLAYAARAMRMLVIDYVRERRALKRGGAFELVALNTEVQDAVPAAQPMEQLGEALNELERTDERLAHLVDLKFFCGYSLGEIAAMWSVSERTMQRDWAKARLLLRQFIIES